MFWTKKKDPTVKCYKDAERAMLTVAQRLQGLERKTDQLFLLVKQMSDSKGQSAEKMADRLIQMAMVQRGANKEASIHRSVSRTEAAEENASDNWSDNDNEWPPPGCAAMRMP